ncbi:MAG: hypothetical protein NVS1B11_06530 [Terriglobales bacterium]
MPLRHVVDTVLHETGQEIAEAALVLPLVFMILLGIYWFGRVFNIYATINHAAREGARIATTFSCATCGNVQSSGSSVDTAVTNSLKASNLDPKGISVYKPPSMSFCAGLTQAQACATTANNVSVCESVLLNANGNSNTTSPVCGTSVSFQYPYQFYFPFTSLNFQQVLLKADVQMKDED